MPTRLRHQPRSSTVQHFWHDDGKRLVVPSPTLTIESHESFSMSEWTTAGEPITVAEFADRQRALIGRFVARHPNGTLAQELRRERATSTPERMPIRLHDLRATFTTLALANGKSENWVIDRTGHKSSAMVARYKRQTRTAAELDLSWLRPLDVCLGVAKPAASPPPPDTSDPVPDRNSGTCSA